MSYRSKSGKTQKIERISKENLLKYVKLIQDQDYPHRPDLMAIVIVDFPENQLPRLAEGDKDLNLSQSTIDKLRNEMSLDNFSKKFPALCQLKK